jgi:hypothetical protein
MAASANLGDRNSTSNFNVWLWNEMTQDYATTINVFLYKVTKVNMVTDRIYVWNCSWQVEEDEMGGPCSTNGGEEELLQIIGGKARGKETTRKTQT